ncbi:MAG: zinc ribbon domain-containing protein [Proteobacteria bacterium]|nr:zinc ribbon domain-containing protein [Pseudomonadota bacterium]
MSGLLRCGECGGPMSICSQKTKAGVRYANFGCTTHRSRGTAICANATTVSEKKVTAALIDALRDTLASPEVQEIFANAFKRRVGERSKAAKPVDFEQQLRAAQQRVQNATRLIVEMPDDLELRRQREADKTEVRRLQAVMTAQAEPATPRVIPDAAAIKASLAKFLNVVASEAPERGREALARTMSPLTVTPSPKGEKPGHLSVTGSFNLASCLANSSSGGRI